MVDAKYLITGLGVVATSTVGVLTFVNRQPTATLETAALEVALAAPAADQAAAATAGAVDAGEVRFCFPDVFTDGPCMPRTRLMRADDTPLARKAADGAARPAEVVLVHPEDLEKPEQAVRTCRVYAALKTEGWGPLSSADMANDAEFLRYCGLVALARIAEPARTSVFKGDALTLSELGAVPADDWPALGETKAAAPVLSADPSEARRFFGDTETLIMRITDVATADFDGDGVAERLVHIAARARGGSAGFATFALLVTDGKAVRMRPVRWQ
jgi:hypothetical protein